MIPEFQCTTVATVKRVRSHVVIANRLENVAGRPLVDVKVSNLSLAHLIYAAAVCSSAERCFS